MKRDVVDDCNSLKSYIRTTRILFAACSSVKRTNPALRVLFPEM